MREEKVHPLKTAKYLFLGIVLCVIVGAVCFFGGRYIANHPAEPEISTVVLESRLSEISEIAVVAYHYTNMAQFENSGQFSGITIPFTTKRFILTYDGTIKAGVDLTKTDVQVSGTAVRVTLPKAEILSHEMDADSVEIFDEKTSIFNPFHVDDFTAFQAEQKAVMEEKAVAQGLLDEAQEKASEQVRLLLSAFLPEEASLTVT
ncbi:MAG: DUF4230 domain-containing protein [Oscillibacter sp.]|nr:DUF4230 domain-containing protein [Oscillibacter sp.]